VARLEPVTRVFLTGANGLIGSWLVKALVDRGDAVTVLERRGRARSPLSLEGTRESVEVVAGEIGDAAALERALRDQQPELVFHLAGEAIVGEAARAPAETFETNVRGTWNLLEACRVLEAPRVVAASSARVYGRSPVAVRTESSPLEPADAYAASKAAADVIARSYWQAHGLRVAVARLGNVYGGGDMNASRLVPEAVWAALEGRAPVIRSGGTTRRDFLYVEDAVAAYLAIADLLVSGERAAGQAFNAGSDTRPSVLEVVGAVMAAAGRPFEADLWGADAGETDAAIDHSLLTELTGWRPRVELADGLRRTVAWYRRHAPTPPADAGGPTT
jgi:CDP-glucose 4,6-dehydratase